MRQFPTTPSYLRFIRSRLTQSPPVISRQVATANMGYPPQFKSAGPTGETGGFNSTTLVPKGKIYKKEPVKVACDRGQTYKWCSCGVSNKQPFCDGRPMCKPVNFKARESKDYMFCNCKQTNKQPFCDGSHKNL